MFKLKVKKKFEKVKKIMKIKNESEKNFLDFSKFRKKRTDIKKSVRIDEIVIFKRKRCCLGFTCVICYQFLFCQYQSFIYWNSKDMFYSDSIFRLNSNFDLAEDVKSCINMDMIIFGYLLFYLQYIDSVIYVNFMVQYFVISLYRCFQCVQVVGLMFSC